MDHDLRCHDDLVVALGHEGIEISSLVLERLPPRAIALKRRVPDAASAARNLPSGQTFSTSVSRVARASVFARRGLEESVWDDYCGRNHLPEAPLEPEKSSIGISHILKALLVLLVVAVGVTLGIWSGGEGAEGSGVILYGLPHLPWVLYVASAVVFVACLLLAGVLVLRPNRKAFGDEATIGARWDFLMGSSDELLEARGSRILVRLRMTLMWALAFAVFMVFGLALGVEVAENENFWFGVAAAGTLLTAAGLWTALRRITKPNWNWVTFGGGVAGVVLLVSVYASVTAEHFYAVLGVPSYSIQPSTGLLVTSNFVTILMALLGVLCAVIAWLALRGHQSPPMSWIILLALALLPGAVLAAGYDNAGMSAYRLLNEGVETEPWAELSAVCLQAATPGSRIEVSSARALTTDVGAYALRVGAAEGRIYYLVPYDAASGASNRYGLVSIPATAVVELQPVGEDELCI